MSKMQSRNTTNSSSKGKYLLPQIPQMFMVGCNAVLACIIGMGTVTAWADTDRPATADELLVQLLDRTPGLGDQVSSDFLDRIGARDVPTFSPEERLEIFKERAQYPPGQEPLKNSQIDLVDPFNPDIARAPRPVIDESQTRGGRRVVDSGIECYLRPQSSISVGSDEPFLVELRCGDFKERSYLPVEIQDIRLAVRNDSTSEVRPALPPQLRLATEQPIREGHRDPTIGSYHPVIPDLRSGRDRGRFGESGTPEATDRNNVYTFEVNHRWDDWGWMELHIDLEVNGIEHREIAMWYSTPHIPAQFQAGRMKDRIDSDGHLIVTVPVEVNRQGYYRFDANLKQIGAEGSHIARSSWRGELRGAGVHMIEFRFFGRSIRVSELDGPYEVTQIRGHRLNRAVTPPMVRRYALQRVPLPEERSLGQPTLEYLEPVGSYKTSAYAVSEFSDNEWESESKDRRIEFLERMIDWQRSM